MSRTPEQRIHSLLRQVKIPRSVERIAKRLNLDPSTVRRVLQEMLKKGDIQKVQGIRGPEYELVRGRNKPQSSAKRSRPAFLDTWPNGSSKSFGRGTQNQAKPKPAKEHRTVKPSRPKAPAPQRPRATAAPSPAPRATQPPAVDEALNTGNHNWSLPSTWNRLAPKHESAMAWIPRKFWKAYGGT